MYLIRLGNAISLLVAIIIITFTENPIATIIGLTLVLSSIFSYFYNQNTVKIQPKLAPINPTIVTNNKQRKINTDGAPYNESIAGDYIGGNYVNEHINVNNQQVDICSDISETFSDFKDILNDMLVKSSNPADAISQFAQELAEELRKQPEVKTRLDDKEHSSEQELANKIIIDLLTKSYEEIRQINQVIKISQTDIINQSSQIQKSNSTSGLEYVEYYINNEDDRDVKYYKGYKICLAKDHDNMWRFEIQREDSSWLNFSNKRRSSSKDTAIGKAKMIIDKDRTNDWKNTINSSR